MRRTTRLFHLSANVALIALLGDSIMPLAAVAQPAPPPLPPAQGDLGQGQPGQGQPGQGQPGQNQADPPARVGRIAGITGAVSFHNQGDTQWSPASVNYPVSTGNAFWTEPSAAAQLEVSDSRIALAGGSEFDIYTLDASGLQGVAVQGETYYHLRDLAPNEQWSVQTPRGLVRLSGRGRYDIVVGATDQPTLVTVVDGSAQIEGPGVAQQVTAGQTATITGTDTFQSAIGPEQRDAFLTERLNAERPAPAPAGVPAQVAVMPGGSDLYRQGTWSPAPEYGQVWYPPVQQGWVPYREGHWAYVAPWGWTWIDDASWGFAPFHYGRWVQIGGRWAWTPGAVAVAEPPVYAPALVAFIGIGAGAAVGAALASGSIGWVPLGPREQYHPWYHASNNYIRRVNVNHVTNVTNINRSVTNNVTINNFVNRDAATSAPAAAMMASRPVQAIGNRISAQQLVQARPIVGQQPLRPSASTVGVTPVVARQLHLPPAAQPRPAPGPVVRAPVRGAAGSGFARPALAPAGAGQAGPINATAQPGPINAAAQPGPRGALNAEPNRPGGTVPYRQSEPGSASQNRQGFAGPGPAPTPGAPPNTGHLNRPGSATPGAAQPNRQGFAGPGSAPTPGTPPGIGQPNRPNLAAPSAVQPNRQGLAGPGSAPTSGTPPGIGQPNRQGFVAPSAPAAPINVGQPNHPNFASPAAPRPAAAPPPVAHPTPPIAATTPQAPPHLAAPQFTPHAAPPPAPRPEPRPEPHFTAPPAQAPHFDARPAGPPSRPEPVAHAAPPPQAHAAPPGPPPGHERKPGER